MHDSGGRPCIINRSDIDFSISHSEGAALCCLAIGADASVGADIQHARETDPQRIEELAKTFMQQRELHMLQISSAADRKNMFYHEWTRRESYFKGAVRTTSRCPGYSEKGSSERAAGSIITAYPCRKTTIKENK